MLLAKKSKLKIIPIGGLNEKTMAAYRAGVKTVIMPKLNEPDLQEIDPKVRDALDFVLVSNVSEVLDAALVQLPKKEKTTDLPPVYGRKSTLPAKARP